MLSEHLQQLEIAKKDFDFVQHLKHNYINLITKADKAYKEARKVEDKEFSEHIAKLQQHDLQFRDWNLVAPNIAGTDFVTDLLQDYVNDIKIRKDRSEAEGAPYTVVVRKMIALHDATDLVEEIDKRTYVVK